MTDNARSANEALKPIADAYDRLRGAGSLEYDLTKNDSPEPFPVWLTARQLARAKAALK
jgi:hypothetical protein